MYTLGFDVGSSSVKVSLLNTQTGKQEATAFSPQTEMAITAHHQGWAEQDPQLWWEHLKKALASVLQQSQVDVKTIKAIGISYQMHGLIAVDADMNVIRPGIIWCDSRAVSIGDKAFQQLGEKYCLGHLLNSPGNFTASKLRWVKENEPNLFNRIHKIMLPGDYLAARLTGIKKTTVSGLSEGIIWDFKQKELALQLLEHYEIPKTFIPDITDSFSVQGNLTPAIANELGLHTDIVVSYRAGDQPNNAFSLNVMEPGEIAATAGTSGVVYGISDEIQYDPHSRVNSFAHVNHSQHNTRLGILLCINGTGILNAWLKANVAANLSYEQMNEAAASVPVGADNLQVMPFGNGAERVLNNKEPGAVFQNLNFNIHKQAHLLRAAQEGIVYSFYYGMEIMQEMGMPMKMIRAGHANMFLSPVFRNTLAGISQCTIELYNTDGSLGAARGAAMGAGIYKSRDETFNGLTKVQQTEPDISAEQAYKDTYYRWKESLLKQLN
ncbi:MAG: carbohydrate kinase [Bacteroidetes bacterium]|jgi:xylulokinase|nr:carbohydrate kinase [Bacteroidota bacterium]